VACKHKESVLSKYDLVGSKTLFFGGGLSTDGSKGKSVGKGPINGING
jgi:hypothetical protein